MADVIKGNVQLYTLQCVGVTDPDMLRRAFHSTQMPPDGFNRGHYANPEVDRLIDAASSALDDDTSASGCTSRRSVSLRRTRPYISLWYKTNVAVAQTATAGIDAHADRRLYVPERCFTPRHAIE